MNTMKTGSKLTVVVGANAEETHGTWYGDVATVHSMTILADGQVRVVLSTSEHIWCFYADSTKTIASKRFELRVDSRKTAKTVAFRHAA